MAANPHKLAENVRRAAGLHLLSLDGLAEFIGMTRVGLMKLLAHDGTKRTALPTSGTLIALAEAFAVDPRVLIEDDPVEVLTAIVESFESAPVRAIAKVPDSEISRPVGTQRSGNVTPLKSKRRKGANRG